MKHRHDTFETSQPWVVYTYGLTHDKWWPFWNSTRVLGRARILMTCAVCGVQKIARIPIPRWGKIPEPEGGKHVVRRAFLLAHEHPDRGHPMSWEMPLLNPEAHPGGMNLDLLGFRLEADINESLKKEDENGRS